MTLLERAALSRAQDAIAFAFSPEMRIDLLAEAGTSPEALTIGTSPDRRLHVLLPPVDVVTPAQVAALLLTCVQALSDAVEQQSATV